MASEAILVVSFAVNWQESLVNCQITNGTDWF